MNSSHNILYDNPPLVVNPEIADIFGLKEALVLQQLHDLLEIKRKNDKSNVQEDYCWIHNTIKKWHEHFPFMSETSIKRVFKFFRDKKIILTRQFDQKNWDAKNYYTIDYSVLEKYIIVRRNYE